MFNYHGECFHLPWGVFSIIHLPSAFPPPCRESLTASRFFLTLLTPTDDPNTFELVARNLKMKARGNQKSNEASQIKSSPHDTEIIKKIVQNQSKINGNRGLDWSWGLLGEAW